MRKMRQVWIVARKSISTPEMERQRARLAKLHTFLGIICQLRAVSRHPIELPLPVDEFRKSVSLRGPADDLTGWVTASINLWSCAIAMGETLIVPEPLQDAIRGLQHVLT